MKNIGMIECSEHTCIKRFICMCYQDCEEKEITPLIIIKKDSFKNLEIFCQNYLQEIKK